MESNNKLPGGYIFVDTGPKYKLREGVTFMVDGVYEKTPLVYQALRAPMEYFLNLGFPLECLEPCTPEEENKAALRITSIDRESGTITFDHVPGKMKDSRLGLVGKAPQHPANRRRRSK